MNANFSKLENQMQLEQEVFENKSTVLIVVKRKVFEVLICDQNITYLDIHN